MNKKNCHYVEFVRLQQPEAKRGIAQIVRGKKNRTRRKIYISKRQNSIDFFINIVGYCNQIFFSLTDSKQNSLLELTVYIFSFIYLS